MAGIWLQARALMRKRRRTMTSRQIADVIDAGSGEVSSVMCLMAKRKKVVRVLPPKGPLRWRLTDAGGAS